MISRGYRYIKKPNHPAASKAGYVLEHRLIMEEHLERYLESKEVVHHTNGNRADNDIENLVLFATNTEHLRFHRSNT